MGRNPKKDAIEIASKNRRILEASLRIFAENTIEKVTMNDVAKAAGIAVSSLYRYYGTKQKLVMAVGVWAWDTYEKANGRLEATLVRSDRTAREMFDFYLESFLNLYNRHRDLLRFNHFFNAYLMSEAISEEDKKPYLDMIRNMETRFSLIYRKALQDGTLRTDLPEKHMFSATLHLMLAVVTRYAVGLVYDEADAEAELRMQKELLMQRFVAQ